MKSLQDQLRKSGLVDEQAARKVASEKRKQQKASHKKRKGQKNSAEPAHAGNAMRDRNAERDRALNQQKQAAQEKRAIVAQIRQLVTTNEITPASDTVPYHFVHGGKVKTLHIDDTLRRQLVAGHLSIVALTETSFSRYALVPDAVARKVAERDTDAVIRVDGARDGGEQDEEDPYAAFEVPDDLMW